MPKLPNTGDGSWRDLQGDEPAQVTSNKLATSTAAMVQGYVVVKGDTLWDIAGQKLGDPFAWTRIYDSNKSLINNPHWIYPGQVFAIPLELSTSTSAYGKFEAR